MIFTLPVSTQILALLGVVANIQRRIGSNRIIVVVQTVRQQLAIPDNPVSGFHRAAQSAVLSVMETGPESPTGITARI